MRLTSYRLQFDIERRNNRKEINISELKKGYVKNLFSPNGLLNFDREKTKVKDLFCESLGLDIKALKTMNKGKQAQTILDAYFAKEEEAFELENNKSERKKGRRDLRAYKTIVDNMDLSYKEKEINSFLKGWAVNNAEYVFDIIRQTPQPHKVGNFTLIKKPDLPKNK